MSIKMICIDLDGTLFSKSNVISHKNIEIIQRAYKNGVHIVVTTGRILSNAAMISDRLKVKCPVIASNGAVICDSSYKNILKYEGLSKEQCSILLEKAKKYKLMLHFYDKDTIECNNISAFIIAKIYAVKNKTKLFPICIKKLKHKDNFSKCIVYSRNKEDVKKFYDEVKEYDFFTVCGSGRFSVEVTAKDVSKGHAVEFLCNKLGIKQEEVMCIGDGDNDISMIKFAGIGVAMGNSNEKLKDISDFVTYKNIDDGVAKAIEKFVL